MHRLFRKFRDRRAARQQEREDGVRKVFAAITKGAMQHQQQKKQQQQRQQQQQCNCSSGHSKNLIFRSASSSQRVYGGLDPSSSRAGDSINNIHTKPTDDDDDDDDDEYDDDSTMMSSVCMPPSLTPPAENELLLLPAPHAGRGQPFHHHGRRGRGTGTKSDEDEDSDITRLLLAQKDEELQDILGRLDELREQHDWSMADKDDELLTCQIGHGFCVEMADRWRIDLDDAQARIDMQENELEKVKGELAMTATKLNETIHELDETKQSWVATSARLDEATVTIERQDREIFDLQKALDQGKIGAKVVLGFLTLGALCADNR
jgi:hypothetical protein